ncbi:LamG-like jellyroll fold domain-containing protein [Microbulbifer mangrovi]|uniref:LamG-like jellyroll fold domain-containing protein n=1 Tax=Microbulbifer mangrovi TaxID=927787 RepID=UPI0009904098|nr:LamG-like jellyroll fold domain-containing protein [Microbulbifer mangrovi]
MKSNIAAVLLALTAGQVVALPERPSIDRDVHMTTETGSTSSFQNRLLPEYTRPTIPALQTSADGRISISHKPQRNGRLAIRLQVPEKFEDPGHPNYARAFVDHIPGTDILGRPDALVPNVTNANTTYNADGSITLSGASITNNILNNNYGGGSTAHHGLCDPTFDPHDTRKNPYACGTNSDRDCYDLVLIRADEPSGGVNVPDENGQSINVEARRIYGIPFTVEVTNPKTANAEITEIRLPPVVSDPSAANNPYAGPTVPAQGFLEPNVAGNGKLLFLRVNGGTTVYYNDSSGNRVKTQSDNVYFFNEANASSNPGNHFAACDVNQWTADSIRPLSHAPYDDSINTRYGFAMQLFRDTENDVIPENQPMSTYPWIDKNADNISFTAVGYDLLDESNENNKTASADPVVSYIECVTSSPDCLAPADSQSGGILNGRIIMGLWTRGKMVLLDNLVNNIDYSLGGLDAAQRRIQLYEPGLGSDGFVRVGNGRDNQEDEHPLASSGNTTFFDSNEHRFNYFRNTLRPVSPADVSWLVSSGRGTTELPFDDYLNPDSFIVANMVQVINMRASGNREIIPGQIQNAATGGRRLLADQGGSPADTEWRIPTSGELISNDSLLPRVEPVANGGIHGKGLWLQNDGDGVRFQIPVQSGHSSTNVSTQSWYYGLFFDQRNKSTGGDKRLITFPDNTSISIRAGNRVIFKRADGTVAENYLIDEPILQQTDGTTVTNGNGWVHLGLQVSANGTSTTVLLYLDGYPVHQFSENQVLFQLQEGSGAYLTLGGGSGNTQFMGWIDEFKVFAQALNPEVACNMANGTIAGVSGSPAPLWAGWASTVPSTMHNLVNTAVAQDTDPNTPTYAQYVCYHNFTADFAAHLGNIPSGLSGVRDNINFPEGPIYFDRERPDSSTNTFCLSCHTSDGRDGLTIAALARNPGVLAINDPRRQPMQPDPFAYGVIPASWVASFETPNPALVGDESNPVCIDEFDLPRFDGSSSYTCVAHATSGGSSSGGSSGGSSSSGGSGSSGGGQGQGLFSTATFAEASGNWNTGFEVAFDDDSSGTEATANARGDSSERVYLEFDFGGSYNNLQFTLFEDDSNPYQILSWRIRRVNATNITNMTGFEQSSGVGPQVITLDPTISASRIRIELLAPSGQEVGLVEVEATGLPE